MTAIAVANTVSRSRGASRPSRTGNAAPKRRGRRECRVRTAPAISCASCTKECAHEHTGSAEALRHSLRNGFTAYNALSPENRALLSPSPPGIWHLGPVGPSAPPQDLTPTAEASGPRDFAVRFGIVRPARRCPLTENHVAFF